MASQLSVSRFFFFTSLFCVIVTVFRLRLWPYAFIYGLAQDKAQRKAQNKCNAYKAVLDWYIRNQPKDKVGKFLGPAAGLSCQTCQNL